MYLAAVEYNNSRKGTPPISETKNLQTQTHIHRHTKKSKCKITKFLIERKSISNKK